ncbi:hypothetical protein [Streptomyces sp. NBC_00102]|uniref:hypothetical protein n=1 Tax=Streptomyces sp. NBC_00102 TaxID=2975652 RepID=UPI00224E6725|nr:hypothetical protein [Streptomyces sp. NBC_00102]MCX5397848.1 hypothetical protein [Streptomyces sp. NBC_00102]
MFDRLELKVLPRGSRFPTQVRFWVNGEDVGEDLVAKGGRGMYATEALPEDRPSPLLGTDEAIRVELGEPECTGDCCGFLTVVVQRLGEIVQWSDWAIPWVGDYPRTYPPPEFHFEASQYDAELARAAGDRWWLRRPAPATPGGSAASSL